MTNELTFSALVDGKTINVELDPPCEVAWGSKRHPGTYRVWVNGKIYRESTDYGAAKAVFTKIIEAFDLVEELCEL